MEILTFIFCFIVFCVVVYAARQLILYALAGGFLFLLAKSIEQGYYWYKGEEFDMLWIAGAGVALIVMLLALLFSRNAGGSGSKSPLQLA